MSSTPPETKPSDGGALASTSGSSTQRPVAHEEDEQENRAGFSVIVLSDDAHGLELGFWNNTIFTPSDNPLYELQASSDLLSWSKLASIPSNTSIFRYTNSTGSPPHFFRVVVP